jgi:hypothetical protein
VCNRAALQAGRGTTLAQIQWLILHGRCQYITDVVCGTEHFSLAFDLAQDPDLPLSTGPVLLCWAREVIDRIGHMRAECLGHLRRRLDGAPAVSWATVASYALVRCRRSHCPVLCVAVKERSPVVACMCMENSVLVTNCCAATLMQGYVSVYVCLCSTNQILIVTTAHARGVHERLRKQPRQR